MKKYFPLVLIILSACGTKTGNRQSYEIDPVAIQLNDSAMAITQSAQDSSSYVKAIALLDQATTIDSNFYQAYWNKLAFQSRLGQNDKSLITAKQLIRLNPTDPNFYGTVGTMYYRMGDTVSANNYYQQCLDLCDKALDTMSVENRNYKLILMDKGFVLRMQGKDKEGNEILKELYDKETSPAMKDMIEMFMNKTREEILINIDQQNGTKI